MHPLQCLPGKTEGLQREALRVFRQKPEHRFFAVVNRQNGNAERNLVFRRFDFKPAVLGHAVLIQLQIRENLDAGDNPGRDLAGQHHRVVQNAVNAVADDHLFLLRFNVYVRGSGDDRVFQQSVHDADNRQVLGGFFQIFLPRLRAGFGHAGNCLAGFLFDDLPELRFQRLVILLENMLDGSAVGKAR